MKKLLSILTVFLVLTGMLHLSVAKHYCGGELAATKVSLSGTLATCGMEGGEGNCQHDQDGDRIGSHCCDDVLNSYSIDNNYTPATKAIAGIEKSKTPVPAILYVSTARLAFITYQHWSDISPPGLLRTTSVDLSYIRVFRI